MAKIHGISIDRRYCFATETLPGSPLKARF